MRTARAPVRDRALFRGRRGLALFAGLLAAAGLGFAQIVENPANPKAADAGRVVTPREVLAISDEGRSDYYFKYPHALTAAPDGSLFVIDENQVMWFGPDGAFERNLFKKGQGPGEMGYADACLFSDGHVIVQAWSPNKLLWFDAAGRYQRELLIRSKTRSIGSAQFVHAGVVYLLAFDFPRVEGTPGNIEVPQDIIAVPEDTGEIETLSSFPITAFVASSASGGGGMMPIGLFLSAVFRRKQLVISHTSEYLLKLYDPGTDRVVREFRRPYSRIKSEPLTEQQKKGGLLIDGKHFGPPEQKYQADIRNLLTRGEEIWAVTSTRDKAKGVLIDVFDGDGAYRDRFWLKLPEPALASLQSPGACALDGEFLWAVEPAKDDTITIRKYRVIQ
ncbi:MAG TPA: hypothetical protein PLP83_06135 [Candidatus Aminicenantes bacterium]|nr:hypothetical protein [Candidatus Aminicenantes bacterium]